MMLNKKNLKKGVSLITVLMFMLVATIAATATYKWLTSENVSSASRMQTARAQQAAVAGLVTAKSWMAYHGNETGAIITQFMASGKKPIHLNSIIKASDTSMVRDSMKYDVWLIGANTSQQPYVLKLASKGFDGSSGEYTEIGIFDVGGLYRVKVPQPNAAVQLSSFRQALFGQSDGITGSDVLESGIINGDFANNNTPVIEQDLLVTGNFNLQGGTGAGNSMYIKGNFSNRGGMYIGTDGANNKNCKAGSDTTVVYIGGSLTECSNEFYVCGDLYVGKNIANNCRVYVTGNMTVGGIVYRSNEGHGFKVDKYLLFEKTGKIEQESNAGSDELKVGKGILLSNAKMTGNLNGYSMNLEALWKYSTSNVSFMKKGGYYEVKSSDPEGPNVLFNANVGDANVIQNLNDLSESNTEISTKLKNVGYWANRKRMNRIGNQIDPSTNKVPDPIILQDENVWKNKTMNTLCNLGESFDMDNSAIEKLNGCYARLSGDEGKLYNGFLVIKWNNTQKKDPTISLNGKFVFYISNRLGQTSIPRTTSNSVAMLYFEQGTSAELLGADQPSNDKMNYFIYSKGNIAQIQKLKLHGSVIMANGSKLNKYQGGNELRYDEAVVSALMLAGFIKSNPEYEKRAGNNNNNQQQQQQQAQQGQDVLDSLYIAVAPQLRISLRTEYKNKEFDPDTVRNGDTVKPSILILPRVLYLPKDPRGKLEDYFDVINLNNAKEQKNMNRVSCSPNGVIPLNGKLYANNTALTEDLYTCTYQSQNYGSIPFYIVVNGNENAMAKVRFENTNYEVSEGQSVLVKVIVEGSNGNPMSVDVYQDNTPLGWTVTGPNSSYVDGNAKLYKVSLTGTGTYSVGAFTVKAGTGASISSGVNLQLQQPCQGCKISSPDHASVFIRGTFTVERKDIEDFCAKGGHEAYCNSDDYKKYENAPSCNALLNSKEKSTPWVQANGNTCNVEVENESWICNTLIYNDVHLAKKSDVNSTLCEVVMPDPGVGNAIYSVSKINEHDTLYASLKRKAYNLNVALDGAKSTGSKVSIYYSRDGKDSVELGYCTMEKCYDNERNMEVTSFRTFAGDVMTLVAHNANGDKFRFWTVGSDENVSTNKLHFVVGEDYYVVANFNKEDAHCFYEDFDKDSSGVKFGSPCNSNYFHRCIDVCSTTPAAGNSCLYDQSRYWNYGTKEENPNWVMVYDNASMPTVDRDGFVYASTPNQNADIPNRSQAVVLSTKENGPNGILTSAFMSDVINGGMVNSGFIFRSNKNASEYYTVSVYGKSSKSRSKDVYVALCYVTSQSADKSKCREKSLPVSSWGIPESEGFNDLTKINMVLSVRNADVSVELKMDSKSVGDVSRSISFNLRDEFGAGYEHNDANHSHVGFKLANPNFRLFDISWISYDYGGKSCWDYPRLMCSFKSNYAGGIVPHRTFVKPWVALSSFVPSKDYTGDKFDKCKVSYYYNGCDNRANYVDGSGWCNPFNEDIGLFWEAGHKMTSESYWFTKETQHGYKHSENGKDGIVMNASVNMECPVGSGMPSSLGVLQSCGEFTVGDIKLCSESREFTGSGMCSPFTACSYTVPMPANVRDAQIKLKVANADNAKMSIYLMGDGVSPKASKKVESSADGEFFIDVAEFLESGFDPEHVRAVVVEVLESKMVIVQKVESICSNAVSAGTCTISYNQSSEKWSMQTNVRNATYCEVVKPSISNAKVEEVGGSCANMLEFSEKDLLDKIGDDATFTFILKAFREKNSLKWDSTKCSYTFAPVKISCSVSSSNVNRGAGVPTLKYKFENCPAEGCYYTIGLYENSVSGGPVVAVTGGPVRDDEYTQSFNANTRDSMMTDGSKTFVIETQGKVDRSCSFNVVDEWATASNCKYDPVSKIFTADVAFEGAEWYGTLDIVDNLGNVHNIKNYTNQTIKLVSETISATINGSNNKLRFTPNGASNKSKSCDVPITAPPISFTNCPSGKIEVAKPGQSFIVSLKTNGCSDGKCSLSIAEKDVTVTPSTGFKEGNVTITDSYGSGSKTYTLKLSHEDAADAECKLDVTYKPQSELMVDCGSNMNRSDVTEKSQVKTGPHLVNGCNSRCNYQILRNGSAVSSGSNYNSGEISFTDANGTGTQSYTMRITDGLGGSKDCPFNVAYKAAGCTPKNYSVPSWNNLSIEEYFSSGCYDLNMDKSCSGVQVTASGSGTIKLNGQSLGCNYWYGTVNSQSSLKLEISAGCSVSKLYLDNCSSGSGSGSGSCNDCISTNFVSYQAGKSYTIKTGSLNESTFHCSASSVSWDRTIGTINGCTIVIPAWNDKSNGRGCSLQSNGQYTFVVNGGAPGDLKCGLSW